MTSLGVLRTRQALDRRQLLSSFPPASMNEGSALQDNASVLTYVEGWRCIVNALLKSWALLVKQTEPTKYSELLVSC